MTKKKKTEKSTSSSEFSSHLNNKIEGHDYNTRMYRDEYDEHPERSLESRDYNVRDNLAHEVSALGHVSSLAIDVGRLPPNMRPHWVRKSCYNHEDSSNMANAMRAGYRTVDPALYPERGYADLLNRNDTTKGYIEQNGLVLCARPASLSERRQQELRRATHEMTTSLEGVAANRYDKYMPMRVDHHKITRGSPFS